jgi:hypothetical protein
VLDPRGEELGLRVEHAGAVLAALAVPERRRADAMAKDGDASAHLVRVVARFHVRVVLPHPADLRSELLRDRLVRVGNAFIVEVRLELAAEVALAVRRAEELGEGPLVRRAHVAPPAHDARGRADRARVHAEAESHHVEVHLDGEVLAAIGIGDLDLDRLLSGIRERRPGIELLAREGLLAAVPLPRQDFAQLVRRHERDRAESELHGLAFTGGLELGRVEGEGAHHAFLCAVQVRLRALGASLGQPEGAVHGVADALEDLLHHAVLALHAVLRRGEVDGVLRFLEFRAVDALALGVGRLEDLFHVARGRDAALPHLRAAVAPVAEVLLDRLPRLPGVERILVRAVELLLDALVIVREARVLQRGKDRGLDGVRPFLEERLQRRLDGFLVGRLQHVAPASIRGGLRALEGHALDWCRESGRAAGH